MLTAPIASGSMTIVVDAPLRETKSYHEFKNFVMDLAREVDSGKRDEEIAFATDSDREDDESVYSNESLYSSASESEVTEARSPPAASSLYPKIVLKAPTGFLIPAFPEVPTLGLPVDDDSEMDLDSVSLATARQSLEDFEENLDQNLEEDETYVSLPRAPQQIVTKPTNSSNQRSQPKQLAPLSLDPYVNYDWMETHHPHRFTEQDLGKNHKKNLFEEVCCNFLSWLPFGFKPKESALVLPQEFQDLQEQPQFSRVTSQTRIVFPSYTNNGAAPLNLAYQMEQTGLF